MIEPLRRPIERVIIDDAIYLDGHQITADITHDVALGVVHVAIIASKVEVIYKDQMRTAPIQGES